MKWAVFPNPICRRIIVWWGDFCLVRHIQKWWNVLQKLIFRAVGDLREGRFCTGDQKLSGVSWNDSGLPGDSKLVLIICFLNAQSAVDTQQISMARILTDYDLNDLMKAWRHSDGGGWPGEAVMQQE